MWTKQPLLSLALLALLSVAARADSVAFQATSLKTRPSARVFDIRVSSLTSTRATGGFHAARKMRALSLGPEELRARTEPPASAFVSVDDGILNISVPEPSSLAMLSSGLIGIAGRVNRRWVRLVCSGFAHRLRRDTAFSPGSFYPKSSDPSV
jgi:hypothetical protein